MKITLSYSVKGFGMEHISHYIDLTSLKDDKSDNIKELLELASHNSEYVPAAICTWPEHIRECYSQTHKFLKSQKPSFAAVLNFPSGKEDKVKVHNDCVFLTEDEYVEEIDYVFDWQTWKSGKKDLALSKLKEIESFFYLRSDIKVILESGAFIDDLESLRNMCREILNLNGVASFLKTSTGKYPVGATPETARVIMEEVFAHNNRKQTADPLTVPCGVKISGGVKTKEDADLFLNMAAEIFGKEWVTPENFRIGASSLYEEVCDIKLQHNSYQY